MPGPFPPYLWPEDKTCAFCFSIDVDATSPYLWSVREEVPQRLSVLEIRRFGPRVGIWRLLELLERHRISGSFYVPGHVAQTWPELLPAIHGQGHELGLHGWFHEFVAESSDDEFSAALDASLQLFELQIGERPRGFRSPAWELTPGMIEVLRDRGFAYDSSLMGFDHPYEIDGLIEVPVQWALDDAIFFKFEGQGRDRWPPMPSAPVLQGWLDEWQILEREGGLFMLTVHDWISGRSQRLAMLERLLERVIETPGVWLATAAELAAWHGHSANRGQFAVDSDIPAAIGPQRHGQSG
jgi:peptidoglycan-N-acetylglucosamine deacetylase